MFLGRLCFQCREQALLAFSSCRRRVRLSEHLPPLVSIHWPSWPIGEAGQNRTYTFGRGSSGQKGGRNQRGVAWNLTRPARWIGVRGRRKLATNGCAAAVDGIIEYPSSNLAPEAFDGLNNSIILIFAESRGGFSLPRQAGHRAASLGPATTSPGAGAHTQPSLISDWRPLDPSLAHRQLGDTEVKVFPEVPSSGTSPCSCSQ